MSAECDIGIEEIPRAPDNRKRQISNLPLPPPLHSRLLFHPVFASLILDLTAMARHDIPDPSCILLTKRSRQKPRAADEEHSLAPNSSNTNGERAMRSSASQEPVDQRPPSSSTPATGRCTPSAAGIDVPSMSTTAIPVEVSTEHGELSPAASIMQLDPEPTAVVRSDHGQETRINVFNYLAARSRTEQDAALNPREEGKAEHEEGKLIGNSTTNQSCAAQTFSSLPRRRSQ